MIFIRRDAGFIPEKILKIAERAQKAVESLPPAERPAFIKKKGHVWRRFARYLSKMSYGKCWYSESPDPQSFFDIDHFRPKLRARRSDDLVDDGYEWLVFSWDNFRYSAQRSNRIGKNDDTGENEGKGDWFPLLPGSPHASWDDRCEAAERPVLLDPVRKADVRLIDVMDDGRMGPSFICIGTAQLRVKRSIELYGLNLTPLKEARLRVMREVMELHTVLTETLVAGEAHPAAADALPVDAQIEIIRSKTLASSAYSRAVRAQLHRLPGALQLCVPPEEAFD